MIPAVIQISEHIMSAGREGKLRPLTSTGALLRKKKREGKGYFRGAGGEEKGGREAETRRGRVTHDCDLGTESTSIPAA